MALATLERAGLLDAVITQNIDRLHARAGTRALIEVHGTIDHSSCLVCGARYPLAECALASARTTTASRAVTAAAPLKPDVVLFGEYLPVDALARAEQLAAGADLMLCIGSSLEVYPVAQLPDLTLSAGGQIAIITQGRTPFDTRAAVRRDGDVVQELDAVLRALGSTSAGRWRRPARAASGARLPPGRAARPRSGPAPATPSRPARGPAARSAPPGRRAATAVAQPAQLGEPLGERGGVRIVRRARPARRRARPAAAAPPPRSRPWSRSRRARSASSSQASGGSRRAEHRGQPGLGVQHPAAARRGRRRADQLAGVGPQAVGDLLAGAVADAGDDRLAPCRPVAGRGRR